MFKDTPTHLDFSCEETPTRPCKLGAAQFWIRRALDAEGAGISKYGLRLWGDQSQGALGRFYHFEPRQADLLALTDAPAAVRQAVNQTIRPLLIDAEALDARWLGELHLKAQKSHLETCVLFATTIIVIDFDPELFGGRQRPAACMFELMDLTSEGECWLIHEYVASPGQQALSKGPYSLDEPGGRFMREPWTKVLAELNATFEAPMLEFAASVRSQTEELRRAFGRRSA